MRFQPESKARLGEEVIGGQEQSRKCMWLSMQLNYGMQALQNKLKVSNSSGPFISHCSGRARGYFANHDFQKGPCISQPCELRSWAVKSFGKT